MPKLTCPICRKQFESTATDSPPFCSARCRQIDLGRWLGETYAVPTSRSEEDDEEALERPPEDE
ncbi:MAG: DNA gyrase inhibitor YacG [Pirellula sp.]|nr:DNA gyrase inhibitor YacG [Pirellula sp.]